ncbi:ABC-type nitrate/sulfonate/bicarbonate transport system permease component [Herbihabitans rhizosphaerae]|uniref:ABC-type nitrate/sulfonate/bicarbonate transport system permease component n=1 Tax=Herbihabitans rhizosphaerae TaxID=1872711 RepID=A0A4Q7KYC9_9PSEU|nr:ABC transporter permease [Herbihabitans rhizosphaerae]RZS41051.1 ABC-type nitrate/sulfonate/bicarbonate transport system permease component [Herbihabitans rhizosphaerae]
MSWFGKFAYRWVVFVGIVVVWQLATAAADDPFFPPPSTIANTIYHLWLSGPGSQLFLTDTVYDDVFASIGRILLGWAIAAVIGVAIGVLLGRSRTAMDYVNPLFAFARSVPSPALVPVFLVLLDIGTPAQLATIVFGVVWPILMNTVDGVRSVDPIKEETARAFRLSRGQWLLGVVLPAAAPKIFAGLRVSLSLSLVLMVISELVASRNGIGLQMLIAQRAFDYPAMWAGIVLLGVLGYLFNTVLLMVENRALSWQPERHTGH